jgi:hypothetical protein
VSSAPVLPTFLVIGAMKAGTTSLHEWLRHHPQVFMPQLKEPEFFSEDDNWRRGIRWYSSLFEPGAGSPVRGEASTGYSRVERFPAAPARAASIVPEARLIYVLRDPIDRMRSHYRHSVLMGRERRSVDDALRSGGGYLDASSYARQIRSHLEHFDRQQLFTVFSDELRADPDGTLRRICSFIGADPAFVPSDLPDEQNVSGERHRLPGPLARAAPRPSVGAVRRRAPRLASMVGRTLGRRGVGVDDRPSEETRSLLVAQLVDDLDDLRSLVGELPASWSAGS